jgi:hypothetical protein
VKKFILIYLIALISLSAYSQIEFSESYSEADLKNYQNPANNCGAVSEVISLYDQGRSLHGVKQQDQDSLHTCYANSISLVLKSKNPKLPTPSYLDIAGHNPDTKNKDYSFNYGWTCEVVKNLKKSNQKLCKTGLIENQPMDLQKELIEKLHDLLTKESSDRNELKGKLDKLESFITQNPQPQSDSCDMGIEKSEHSHIQNVLYSIADPYLYEKNQPTDTNISHCSKHVQRKLMELGLIKNITEVNINFDKKKISLIEKDIINDLKKMKISKNSNQTVYSHLSKEIDSKLTTESSINHFFSNTTANTAYSEKYLPFIKKALQNNITEIIGKSFQGQPECLSHIKKQYQLLDPSEYLLTLNYICHQQNNEWNADFNSYVYFDLSCSDQDYEIYNIYSKLNTIGMDIKSIGDFVLNSDKNTLKDLISKNCEEKNRYDFGKKDCKVTTTYPELDSTATGNWKVTNKFENYLKKYLLENPENKIDFNKFTQYMIKSINEEEKNKDETFKSTVSRYFGDFMNNEFMSKAYSKLSTPDYKFTKESMLALFYERVESLKKKQADARDSIVKEIKNGHATSLSICAESFYEEEKHRHLDCKDHNVTMTGAKCVNGRLKLEIANSWGIGCMSGDKTSNLMECQKDKDGLPNGRSWVDYNYLSDQSIEINSF